MTPNIQTVDAMTFEKFAFHVYDYDCRSSIPQSESLYRLGDRIITFKVIPTEDEIATTFNEYFKEFQPNFDCKENKFKPICIALRLTNDNTIPLDPQLVVFGTNIGKVSSSNTLFESHPIYPSLIRVKEKKEEKIDDAKVDELKVDKASI